MSTCFITHTTCTLIPYLNIFQVSCQRKVRRIPTSCRCPTTLKTADLALLRWPRWPRPLTSRWGELCACGWTRCHSRNPTSCDSHVKAAWGMYFYSFCPFFKHPVSLGFIRQCCTRRLHSIIFPSLYNIKIKNQIYLQHWIEMPTRGRKTVSHCMQSIQCISTNNCLHIVWIASTNCSQNKKGS